MLHFFTYTDLQIMHPSQRSIFRSAYTEEWQKINLLIIFIKTYLKVKIHYLNNIALVGNRLFHLHLLSRKTEYFKRNKNTVMFFHL